MLSISALTARVWWNWINRLLAFTPSTWVHTDCQAALCLYRLSADPQSKIRCPGQPRLPGKRVLPGRDSDIGPACDEYEWKTPNLIWLGSEDEEIIHAIALYEIL